MKIKGLIAFLVGSAACMPCAIADTKWELRRETSGNQCHVQRSDSQPQRGKLVSSQDTREKACQEAKKQFDSSMSSPDKCWGFDSATIDACKSENVDLKKKS